MHILIEKKELLNSISIISNFTDKKSAQLKVLSSILIIAKKDGIKMRATNLEIGADIIVKGTCITEGVVSIQSNIIQQIVNSFTQSFTKEGDTCLNYINLEHIGDILSITSGNNKSLIKTLTTDDFPLIPFPKDDNKITLSGLSIKNIFTSVGLCALPSTIRPELASIYFIIEGGIITVVATDLFRLTEKKIPLINKGVQGSFLIPAKNAIDISHVLPDEDIDITFDDNQCSFSTKKGIFVSRLTNAVYPDYKQIIPKEVISEAIILRKDFENVLKRIIIFSDTFQKVRMSFDKENGIVHLFAKNIEVGEASETIAAKISGDDIEVSLNHKYLLTIFTLLKTESISITATGIGRPIIVRGVGDNSLLYLISTMNQ